MSFFARPKIVAAVCHILKLHADDDFNRVGMHTLRAAAKAIQLYKPDDSALTPEEKERQKKSGFSVDSLRAIVLIWNRHVCHIRRVVGIILPIRFHHHHQPTASQQPTLVKRPANSQR